MISIPQQMRASALIAGAIVSVGIGHIAAETPDEADAAYTRTITERADRIVSGLKLRDPATAEPLRDALIRQYRALNEIHDARDPASDAKAADGERDGAAKLIARHRRFAAELSALLAPEEVDRVKDSLTYGVVPITYRRYCELLPGLSNEEKREVLAQLFEAREYAMDGGSSEEKHAIFGKYKGRINNFLSKAGYDLKQAESEWTVRRNAAATAASANTNQ